MSIREYSMTRDSTRQLSPGFRVREFACKGSDVVLIDDEVERYRKAGCDFSSCTTDEDYLAAIEAFEDNPPVADAGVSDQTRIADALEDMVALSLPDAE